MTTPTPPPFGSDPTTPQSAVPIVPGPNPAAYGQPTPPGPYGAPPPAAVAPPRKGLSTWAVLGICAAVLVVLCCGVGVVVTVLNPTNSSPNSNAAGPTGPGATSAAFAPDPGDEPVETTPPPPQVPADQTFQGSSAKVVKLKLTEGFLHTATITYRGGGNFVIWSVDGDGENIDLLVNTIGNYSGVRAVDFTDTPAALKIESSGSWKVVVKALQKAPVWPAKNSGTGDAVLLVDKDELGGLATINITHKGRSNFAVWVYGESQRDLVVNEIGKYSGETLLPSWAVVIEITADGAWTIKKT